MKTKRNWRLLAQRLARKLDQSMGGARMAKGFNSLNVHESLTWCHHADQLITQAGLKPGSSKRYNPTKDKS